jgi:hypothetical protein
MKISSNEVAITPKTKIKVGTEVRGIANGLYATVVKVVNNTYHLQFAIDYADERPTQRSRKKLEAYYHIVR